MSRAERMQLQDLCDLVSRQVDPTALKDALYVGLEHLAPGRMRRIGSGLGAEVQSGKFAFEANDVLYGKLRPYLDKAVLAEAHGLCTTELLVLRPKATVDSRFLACVVHTPAFVEHAMSGVTGAHHPRTSWTHIANFSLPCFTLAEQRELARFLWRIHDLRDACQATLYAAQRMKQAAMRGLFTRGLRGEAQKETEIGLVPESWMVTTFAAARKRLQYGTSTRCSVERGAYPVLRIPNVEPGRVNAAELKYCDLTPAEADKYLLVEGDLLFIRTNGVLDRLGSCAVYDGQPNAALFASYLIRAQLKPGIEPRYAAYFYGSELGTSLVAGRATPAADGKYNLNTGTIDSLPLALPATLDEQRDIVAILAAIDRKITLHQRKRAVLEELFKSLLHKLMTGDIAVADLDLSALGNAKEAA
jgi:type I restriction enzyme, S subunit